MLLGNDKGQKIVIVSALKNWRPGNQRVLGRREFMSPVLFCPAEEWLWVTEMACHQYRCQLVATCVTCYQQGYHVYHS